MDALEDLGAERGAGSRGESPQAMKKSDSSEVLNLSLHQCARDGDEYNMKILLRQLGHAVKRRINQLDEDELTPLHYAARYNFLPVVKLLVESGADVNRRGEDDVTPLHHAARYRREKNKKRDTPSETNDDDECGLNGVPLLEMYEAEFGQSHESVITYLISKGAKVDAVDIYGQTPLHFAAMRGNEVACKDLLSHRDASIEAQDKQGISPLHMAALHNQVEVALTLIQAGANLRCTDNELSTPLHHACAEGDMQLVQALFDAGAKSAEAWVMISNMVTDQDVEGSTCLHRAIDNGHYEVTKMCLEKRAEVNRPRKHYTYPLHLAALSGDVRIAQLLMDHSARIDVVNDEQATALHKAASLNHVDMVQFLVDRGARINRRDKDNYTPLLLAATYGHVDTVQLLLHKGADCSAVDKYDKTAIYLAAEENKLAVLEKLLSYPQVKRLINVSDQYDATPLHVACQNGYLDIVRVLIRHEANIACKNEEEQTPIHLAAKYGRTSIVREIVGRDKSTLNDEDEDSNTALHLAAEFGHTRVAEILLELGADVSARNYNQWTPLDLAASKGWTKTCSVLLNNDAHVDPTDKNKTTPLHLASRYGHARVVELLLDWGADVAFEDTEGNNCLDLAIENNRVSVAMTIINSDVWQQSLRNSTVDTVTKVVDTPMRKLIKRMPEVAERCFDRCMSYGQEKNSEHREFEITFNYEFLDDTYMPWINENYRRLERGDDSSSISETSSVGSAFDEDHHLLPGAKPYTSDSNLQKKNHPLFIMVTSEREILLAHPLVTSLLNHKWTTFGRFFYYLSLTVYCVFVTFITGYIVHVDPPHTFDEADRRKIEDNECDSLSKDYSQNLFTTIATYVIISLAVINLLKELLQIYQAKLGYLGWINLIEWTTYVTALLLVISFNDCQRETGYRYTWQWSAGAVSVFLTWINLVLFIQKFPQLGIYVVMFTDVLSTFAHFFVVFFLFIIAFALAFYTVLQDKVAFETVPKALIKTSVMMIGEFDFDSIFNEPTNQIKYDTVGYLVFVVFLIVMAILLMNLLVGLAVDDIKAVQEQAALKRMAMQVKLALDVERVIPDFIRRKAYAKWKTMKPNKISNPFQRFFNTQSGMTARSLKEHLHTEKDDMEKLHEKNEKMSEDVKNLRRNMNDLRETSQRIESMLRAVIRSNNVEWEDEDYQEEDEVEQIEAGLSY
ncbi:transient receptor potential cation channel subfamily A member 1 homolog [Babylonia areolata]|uniref:transient receptor potential cation channel subfamily A member 1 homolog n=1 Tax=Babylonia areolata TaxID=304850 RepID=UPI003FD64B41